MISCVIEVEITFQSDIGNHTRNRLAKISSNTTINRSAGTREKGSNKRVLLSTAVAMEEWQMRFSDGLFGDILSIHLLHANY